MQTKTLMIGDIIGHAGLRKLIFSLPELKKKYSPDLIIVNGENTHEGFGILPEEADTIFQQGVDVITSGNHIWHHEDFLAPYWEHEDKLLRPHNYPSPAPGKGFVILEKKKMKFAVINLQGRQLMPHLLDCPLTCAQAILKKVKAASVKQIFVDFHAEMVTEKEVMAYALDGQITALVGTHTHTPTMDEKILPNGSAYVSDLGMVGATPSVIGSDIQLSITKAISQIPSRSAVAESEQSMLCGLFIESDDAGKATRIERIIMS
jgi:2',3'-cyclic-nucleotide 2'-phosphodiesterase